MDRTIDAKSKVETLLELLNSHKYGSIRITRQTGHFEPLAFTGMLLKAVKGDGPTPCIYIEFMEWCGSGLRDHSAGIHCYVEDISELNVDAVRFSMAVSETEIRLVPWTPQL